MAKKTFYSIEEVCEKLGKSQDDIKGMVRGGMLREFRDAGKVFFKAEDIDKLAGPSAAGAKEDTGSIILEPADLETLDKSAGSGVLPPLTESSGGTSIIGLEPLPDEEEKKEDTAVTTRGIGVFDEDEGGADADPMAKTQITTGATDDQITLEGAGSGSGLLDLAREADDTALGADLLDEIYPGEEEAAPAPAAAAETPAPAPAAVEAAPETEEALEDVGAGEVIVPVMVSGGDPAEGMFGGLLVGGLILMGVAASVVGGVLQGFLPDYGRFLTDGTNFFFFLGGAVVVPALALLAGWFLGKSFAPKRRKLPTQAAATAE